MSRAGASVSHFPRLLAYNESGGFLYYMGTLGPEEMVAIFILALLLFGPKELPKLGKTIGKAMTEFRRAQTELKSTFDREMRNLERETGIKELTATTFNSDSYNYDHSSYDASYYDGSYDSTVTTTRQTAHPQLRAPGRQQRCRSKRRPAPSRAAIWNRSPRACWDPYVPVPRPAPAEHGHSARTSQNGGRRKNG